MYRPFLLEDPPQKAQQHSPRGRTNEKKPAPVLLKHDVSIKIVVVGAQGTGKTTMIRQYTGKRITTAYTPTFGPEVTSKYVPLDSLQCHMESLGKLPECMSYDRVKVDFWEVPHQELYGENIARILGKANGFVFVFESSDPTSFGAVNEWFSAIKVFKTSGSRPERSESPSVVPSPPIMPVKSGCGISSTMEYGKACPFSVPSILLANKSDINNPTVEGASLISGLNAYCLEYGALFWAKTSSFDGSVLKYALDTFVNSVFDNYLRREELRIVMGDERSKARRPKIRLVQQVQIVSDDKELVQGQSPQQVIMKQNEAKKALLLEKAEKLQKDVKEYRSSGKDTIQSSPLQDDKKKEMLDKFDDEFAKMEAAVSTLVASATAGTSTQKPGDDDDLGKVIGRVQAVLDKKKAKWNDVLSKEIK